MKRQQHGQATVEFVLLTPLLLVAVMTLIQIALVVRTSLLAHEAAHVAARVASLEEDQESARVIGQRVLSDAEVSVTRGAVGDPVVVIVRATVPAVIPMFGAIVPSVSARAEMRAER